MVAFAANSVMCRLALLKTAIDPATFTSIRIVSGALVLWIIVVARNKSRRNHGDWISALALFTYAIAFSFAYVKLSVATGALLLFGAVQATMIGWGRWRGERFTSWQLCGFVAAIVGLIGLLLPGVTAPSPSAAIWMLGAGIAWGAYSLRGARNADPTAVTAGNFLRAVPFAITVNLLMISVTSLDAAGVAYAVASGALASGVGYAIWYAALPGLTATTAATVQLSVPVLAAFVGVVALGEQLSLRLVIASTAILGGIALVVFERRSTR
jgi:drug/metabolite transporter (DMT)-like permease